MVLLVYCITSQVTGSVIGKIKILLYKCTFKMKVKLVLAGVAQWIEFRPANQRVTSSLPSQGTCLGCGLGPQ